ncbi:hypothetical protein E24_00490 [Faustovirus]|nr:hypothetical protein PRJ_Fausto_00459 [Faustovirus]AMN83403.1 hypothetical protein E24_00490 [Faustovirus]AMN84385.1 hypothetical protein D5a_00488 [Faustovirus]AMN85373.1 hypothetical protein E23_00490 [Faustovirus]QBR99364.1 hypothetical protein [Faustovirus mariensis]
MGDLEAIDNANLLYLPNELIFAIGEISFEVYQKMRMLCKHLNEILDGVDVEIFTTYFDARKLNIPMLNWLKLLPDGRVYSYEFDTTPLIRKDKRKYRYVLIYEYFINRILKVYHVCGSCIKDDNLGIYLMEKNYSGDVIVEIKRTLNGQLHGEQYTRGAYFNRYKYYNNGVDIGSKKQRFGNDINEQI